MGNCALTFCNVLDIFSELDVIYHFAIIVAQGEIMQVLYEFNALLRDSSMVEHAAVGSA
jgi:hypothetical protein